MELLQKPETQKVRDLGTLLENCTSLNLDFVVDEALKDKGLKKRLQTAVGSVDKISVADVAANSGLQHRGYPKNIGSRRRPAYNHGARGRGPNVRFGHLHEEPVRERA